MIRGDIALYGKDADPFKAYRDEKAEQWNGTPHRGRSLSVDDGAV
jgi:hypothetical protein